MVTNFVSFLSFCVTSRQKKIVDHGVKTKKKDPLNRIHSKLGSSDNASPNQPPNATSGADRPTAATSSAAPEAFSAPTADVPTTAGGVGAAASDESISARTEEVVPALLSMRDGAGITVTGSGSVEVDGAVLSRDNEEADPSAPAGTFTVDATVVHTKDGVVCGKSVQRSTTPETVPPSGAPATSVRVAPATHVETVVSPRRSPRKRAASSSSALDHSNRDAVSGFVSASSLFPPAAQSKAAASAQVDRSADAPAKQPVTSGDAPAQQLVSSRVDKLPVSSNLRSSKLPINMGVPYTPTIDPHGKGIAKKNVIEIPDNTPHPTVKPRGVAAAGNDLFVDLSPLTSAKKFLQNPSEHKERHPMAFSPSELQPRA